MITFTIPFKHDHPDRLENIEFTTNLLKQQIPDCEIIVFEFWESEQKLKFSSANYDTYLHSQSATFHRTKALNIMAKLAKFDKVANWDCDCFTSKENLLQAIFLLDKFDFVYPYNGQFFQMPRIHLKQLKKQGVSYTKQLQYPKHEYQVRSVGGAVMYNKAAFISAGMENEKFISWSPEDSERYHRWEKLGYKIGRSDGALYHINHWRGVDSSGDNPHYHEGRREYRKIQSMSKYDLRAYVNTWSWL